jgi:hypothetical protein
MWLCENSASITMSSKSKYEIFIEALKAGMDAGPLE